MAQSRARYIVGTLIIIVILAIAAGVYCFTHSSLYALHGVRYLAGPFQSRTLYEMDWRGPKEVTLPVSGHVIDYARENGHEAAITLSDDSSSVYTIENGKAKKRVSDDATKSSIDISSDGTMVAYAERIATSSAATTPNIFYAPDGWEIMLLGPNDTEPHSLGQGYAPHFFTKGGKQYLAYTTINGLHFVDIATNTHQDVSLDRSAQPDWFFTAAVSSDGEYAAVPVSSSYSLFALNLQNGSFTLSPAGTLPPYTNTVAFSGPRILTGAGAVNNSQTLLRLLPISAPDTIAYGKVYPYVQVYKVIP